MNGREDGALLLTGRRRRHATHISSTVFSCSSLDFFSSISQSLCWPTSTSSRRAISSTSC